MSGALKEDRSPSGNHHSTAMGFFDDDDSQPRRDRAGQKSSEVVVVKAHFRRGQNDLILAILDLLQTHYQFCSRVVLKVCLPF
jgi:hypothetical protein